MTNPFLQKVTCLELLLPMTSVFYVFIAMAASVCPSQNAEVHRSASELQWRAMITAWNKFTGAKVDCRQSFTCESNFISLFNSNPPKTLKSTVLFVGFLPLVGATSRKSPSPSFSDHPAFRAIQDLAATFRLHRDLCANLPASAANATTPTGRNHWWAASCPKSPGGEHFWKNLHPKKKKRNTKQNPKTQIHYGSLENLDWSLIGLLFVGENRCWPRSGANHPRHTRPSADSVEVQVPAGSLGFSGIPDLQLENPRFLLRSNVAPFKHHKKIPTGFSIYHGNHQICQLHSGRWLAVKQIPINLSLTRLWKGERWGGIKAWRNLLNSR